MVTVVQAALALLSAGKTTGVVVDIGATGSLITPVYEGTPLPSTGASPDTGESKQQLLLTAQFLYINIYIYKSFN